MIKKFSRDGEVFIWMTAAALALSLLMLIALLLLIAFNGLRGFWPSDIALVELKDGRSIFGYLIESEPVPDAGGALRVKIKRGNRDLYGEDFIWIDNQDIKSVSYPEEALAVERTEWGDFYGTLTSLEGKVGDEGDHFSTFQAEINRAVSVREEAKRIARSEIGAVSYRQERIRLERRSLEKGGGSAIRTAELDAEDLRLSKEFNVLNNRLINIRDSMQTVAVLADAAGTAHRVALFDIVRSWQPNRMSLPGKVGMYFGNIWSFIVEDPREANTEGGVAPAIFGTVLMVLLMTVVVTPLGVVAAIYLHEYARPGPMVSLVRVAVNNLAGVPSIVFGVFGVGFFIYFLGGSIDQLFFSDALPTPTYGTGGILWASLTLALLTVPTVIVAAEEGLSAIPRHWREASYALGATKFETTWRVVIPALAPAILTGVILAVARAAGEVAPLMITGVVKMAPDLPMDGYFPYLHLDRKFMHLGFHIYDLGFQSPNVDAARPAVFATTLLLVALVVALNLVAIVVRNRLRKKFVTGGV